MEKKKELLRFAIGLRPLGVWMEDVEEILKIPVSSITMLPNSPPQLYGLANLRGQALPVLDTRLLLENQSWSTGKIDEQGIATVLLCRHEKGPAGLLVDELDDVVDSVEGTLQASWDPSGLLPWVFSTTKDGFEVLSVERILQRGLEKRQEISLPE